MSLNFNDFDKQDIKFDINELQKAYKEILKIKDFDGPEGIPILEPYLLLKFLVTQILLKVIRLEEYSGQNLIQQEMKLSETRL